MAARILIAIFGMMLSTVMGLSLGAYATDGVSAAVPPPPAYRSIRQDTSDTLDVADGLDAGERDYRY